MYKWKTLLIFLSLLLTIGTVSSQEIVNQRQVATRYHHKFENRRTSSGERFSQKKYTAAHRNIKLGTYVLVVDTVTNKWVVVKVNDRCPRKNVIDLAAIAAERIGLTKRKGVARVKITTLTEEAETLWAQQESMPETIDDSILSRLFNSPENPLPEKAAAQDFATNTKSNVNKHAERSKTSTDDGFASAKLLIYNIENTKKAEELLSEMQPTVALNAKILNDTDSIKIEIIMKDLPKSFVTNFKNKHPQYNITEIYNYEK